MRSPLQQPRKSIRSRRRRGAALLMCLFVIFMVSALVLNVLDTETKQLATIRNVTDYERALYLANAGVHHACAMLTADATWRNTITDGTFPNDNTYTATASDIVDSNFILIEASGAAGDVVRSVEATIEL